MTAQRRPSFADGNFEPTYDQIVKGAVGRLAALRVLEGTVLVGIGLGMTYVVGGIAEALRLHYSQGAIPVEAGLSVIPHSQFLLVGVRDMVNALLAGTVLVLLAMRPIRFWIGLTILLLVVPLSAGGFAWPAGLVALRAAFYWASHTSATAGRRRMARMPLVLAGVALLVVLARYTDPPDRFARGQVFLATQNLPNRFHACGSPRNPVPNTTSPTLFCISGSYVATSDGRTYFAIPAPHHEAEIVAEPSAEVKEVRLFESPGGPRTSVLAWLVGQVTPYRGARIEATSLALWRDIFG
jgi:hypothetical protein